MNSNTIVFSKSTNHGVHMVDTAQGVGQELGGQALDGDERERDGRLRRLREPQPTLL